MATGPGARSAIKRSGTRRRGDGYQDVVALDVLVEWLEHPGRYAWVRVEADDAGSLDDVTALRRDGTLVVLQVKYATAPEADDGRLTWDLLLERPAGRTAPKPSLLEKWAASLRPLAAAVFRRGGGHPLHLRYMIRTVQERGLLLPEDAGAGMPDCHHDGIAGYYAALWQALPDPSRQLLHLLAATRFPWPREGCTAAGGPTR